MATSIRVYKDAINAYKNNLLESEANLIIIDFIRKILNIKKPDLVILIRD